MAEDGPSSVALAWGLLASGDAALWAIVGRSLQVSGTASVLGGLLGLLTGAGLAMSRCVAKPVLLGVAHTLLALPPVVVGLAVVLLLSRSGPLGAWGWLFSPAAMIVAQTVLVWPIVTALVHQLLAEAERQRGEPWAALDAGPAVRAALLLWDERLALVTVGLMAFGRAISEVGAVMVVGGNIEGHTRVMTTAIALEAGKGDLPLALALGLVLLVVVGVLQAAVALLQALSRPRWPGRAGRPGGPAGGLVGGR